jgi:serine/threonine-protein kinase
MPRKARLPKRPAPMSPARWIELEPLVDHALDLPIDHRVDYIAKIRERDAALGADLEQFIADYGRPDDRLDDSAPARFAYLLDDIAPPLLKAGAVLARRYRVGREIGRGGMATVYLANDMTSGQEVAVKVMRRSSLATTAARRFRQEIRLTEKLRHPNIVPLLDAGEFENDEFYVMPFIRGETLRRRLDREGRLPITEALSIGIEIATALEYAHQLHVIHRDVKPSNVLLTERSAMLADFGVARAEESERFTDAGVSVGTPAYMSPEQIAHEIVDCQTDVYSLGYVLYEMIAGTAPYAADVRLRASLRGRDPVINLRALREEVSPELESCILGAIAVDKRVRTRSCCDLAVTLRACAENVGDKLPPK